MLLLYSCPNLFSIPIYEAVLEGSIRPKKSFEGPQKGKSLVELTAEFTRQEEEIAGLRRMLTESHEGVVSLRQDLEKAAELVETRFHELKNTKGVLEACKSDLVEAKHRAIRLEADLRRATSLIDLVEDDFHKKGRIGRTGRLNDWLASHRRLEETAKRVKEDDVTKK